MAWEARHTQIWQLHMQGLSQSAIARAMAMPRTTVRDALRRLAEHPPATTGPADVLLDPVMRPEVGSDAHERAPAELSRQLRLADPPLAAEEPEPEGAVQPSPMQELQILIGQLHGVLGNMRQLEDRRMQHLEVQIQYAEESTRQAAAALCQALQQFQDAAVAQRQLVNEITAAIRQTLQTSAQLLQAWPRDQP
jgi:hypothetical protein